MLLMTGLDLIINFDNFWQLLPLVYSSIVAAMILGVLAGLIGPMIQARDMAFAVHGTAELSFAGAYVCVVAWQFGNAWSGNRLNVGRHNIGNHGFGR